MHSVGGATLARRKLAEQRNQIVRTFTHEEISTSLLHSSSHNAQFIEKNKSATELGINYSSLALPKKSYLESFSYKDLSTLRELHINMEKKKEIR